MALDVQQVEQLNRKAQQLNADRQQRIGMQQAAQQAYDRAVLAYEQKYGVKLDDSNLQSEYTGVHAQLEQAFVELNDTVVKIENGEFAQQVEPSIVQNDQPVQVGTQQQAVVQPTITQSAVQQAMQQATQQSPIAGANPVQTGGFGFGVTQQSTTTIPPVVPQTNTTGVPTEPADQAFTPTGWGTTGASDPNQHFAGINNGKPFGQ